MYGAIKNSPFNIARMHALRTWASASGYALGFTASLIFRSLTDHYPSVLQRCLSVDFCIWEPTGGEDLTCWASWVHPGVPVNMWLGLLLVGNCRRVAGYIFNPLTLFYCILAVSAVHDGYLLRKSVLRSPISGHFLTKCMQQTIEDKGTAVMPRYSIKRVEKGGNFAVETLDFPKTTESFRAYHVDAICQDAKHVVCRVSDNPFNPDENANIPNVTYELPDGQEIQIGPQRFSIPELLFNPTLAKGFGEVGNDMLSSLPEAGNKGLPQLVTDCIEKCDVDARRELYNGIVLTGGTSLFTSLRERIEKEVTNMAPSMMKVRVTSPANPIERRYSTWIGGSILSSLGTFQQMWMSKSEYKEHGSGLIHKKAP